MIDRLSDAALALLGSAAVATIVTLNEDGSPHVSSAWVGIEDGEICFATLPDQRKLHNIRRDPRVAVTIQDERINDWGLDHPYRAEAEPTRLSQRGCAMRACSNGADIAEP